MSSSRAGTSNITHLVRFVRVLVELVEQEEEHDGVHSDPPDERLRVVAVDEEQLERVHHDGHKLDLKGWEKSSIRKHSSADIELVILPSAGR